MAATPVNAKEVGPGRPPEHSRFKPGQSGNPRGRPPRKRDLRKLIEEELDQLVSLTEGSKRIRLTKREVMVKKLVNDAARGEAKPLAMLLRLIGTTSEEADPYSGVDAAQIAAFIARHLPRDAGSDPLAPDEGDGL